MQDVLGGDGGGPDPGLGEGEVLGDGRVEVVADHQHVEVLLDGVDGVRPRGVGGRGQHVRLGDHRDHVRGVAAAGAFDVEGVDGAAGDGGEGVAEESGLVEGVGVDGELGAALLADVQAGVAGRPGSRPSPHGS